MKLGCCNELFDGWSLEDTFAAIARAGYDGVELTPYTIAPYVTEVPARARTRIRSLARENGLDIIGLHWVLARTEVLHVSHPDAAIRARTADYLVELVRFCADVGGQVIVFGSPKQRDLLPAMEYEEAFARAQDTFRPAALEANDRGVTICMEPLRRDISNFLNRAEEAVRFVTEMNEPSMRIILDCYSMGDEGKPREQLIEENAAWLAHVHANDVNQQGPGMAENGVDFAAVFSALHKIGYQAYVSVESFDFSPGAEETARRSIEHMRWAMEKE